MMESCTKITEGCCVTVCVSMLACWIGEKRMDKVFSPGAKGREDTHYSQQSDALQLPDTNHLIRVLLPRETKVLFKRSGLRRGSAA